MRITSSLRSLKASRAGYHQTRLKYTRAVISDGADRLAAEGMKEAFFALRTRAGASPKTIRRRNPAWLEVLPPAGRARARSHVNCSTESKDRERVRLDGRLPVD